jgi:hypothetical protein
MKPFITTILLLSVINLSAQDNSENTVKPKYGIHLTTMQGNMLKGLLLQVNDSSLIIYPGNRKDWNRKVEYYPVVFVYSNVNQIKLKKKNAMVKGMLIGGGAGLSAILTTVLLNNVNAKGGSANNMVIVIPAGIVGGAYLGIKSKKEFYINGNMHSFNELKKQIQ